MMCATCYAINKKVVNILNKKDNVREDVNKVFDYSNLSHLKYEKNSFDSTENMFYVYYMKHIFI